MATVELSCSRPVRGVLLFVHLLFSCFQQIFILACWIHRKALFWQSTAFSQKQTVPRNENLNQQRFEDATIERAVCNLPKLPSHLVVMLGPDAPDYSQLSRFVHWCLAAGIGHVSFYDQQGILKQNHQQMLHYVMKQPRADSEQIVWTPQLNTKDGLLPPRNGYRRRIVVSFFAPENGKRQLAAIAKKISNRVRDQLLAPANITIDLVDEMLQDCFFRMPDPELAIYLGSVCSTFGMLPWQIRLTEFVPLNAPSLAEMDTSHFVTCLYHYAKCEQRLGK